MNINEMNLIVEYAPIILLVIAFIMREKIFVTPYQLEKSKQDCMKEAANQFVTLYQLEQAKRNNMKEAETKFASLLAVERLDNQFNSLTNKLDKIYEILIGLVKDIDKTE